MIRVLDNPRRVYASAGNFAWDVLRWMEDELWPSGVCYIFPGRVAERFGCSWMEAGLALLYLQGVDAVGRTQRGHWYVRRCTSCGCTLRNGCRPRCRWVGTSLCSSCHNKEAA